MTAMIPTSEQTQIIDSVRAFLRVEQPLARLRNNHKPEITAEQWRMATDLGLFGIGLPEEAGGIGQSMFDETLVMRELGRMVTSPSLLATALGVQGAHAAGRMAWRDALLSGERRAHLVVAGRQGRNALCVDRRDTDDDALLFVVWPEGVALLEARQVPFAREVPSFDAAVTLHPVQLDLASAWQAPIGSGLAMRAQLMLAAQLVGLSEEARDLTADYAKTRQQFGVAIGSFQAVKHRCADMAVACEVAWAQVGCAAHALEHGFDNAATAVASAHWLAATAAHACGDSAIQVHGGIGYQAECDVHHFMKRAHLYDLAAGGRSAQAGRLAAA